MRSWMSPLKGDPLDQRQVLLSSPGQAPQHPEQVARWTRGNLSLAFMATWALSVGLHSRPVFLDSTLLLVVGGELGEGVMENC